MRILTIAFLFLLPFPQDSYKLLKKVEKQADFLTTDNLGNSYLSKRHELSKYLPNGDFQYTFSNANSTITTVISQ